MELKAQSRNGPAVSLFSYITVIALPKPHLETTLRTFQKKEDDLCFAVVIGVMPSVLSTCRVSSIPDLFNVNTTERIMARRRSAALRAVLNFFIVRRFQ